MSLKTMIRHYDRILKKFRFTKQKKSSLVDNLNNAWTLTNHGTHTNIVKCPQQVKIYKESVSNHLKRSSLLEWLLYLLLVWSPETLLSLPNLKTRRSSHKQTLPRRNEIPMEASTIVYSSSRDNWKAYTEYEQFLHHELQHLPEDFAERKETYHLTTSKKPKTKKKNNTFTLFAKKEEANFRVWLTLKSRDCSALFWSKQMRKVGEGKRDNTWRRAIREEHNVPSRRRGETEQEHLPLGNSAPRASSVSPPSASPPFYTLPRRRLQHRSNLEIWPSLGFLSKLKYNLIYQTALVFISTVWMNNKNILSNLTMFDFWILFWINFL